MNDSRGREIFGETFGGKAPEKGGTTTEVQEPLLAPDEQGTGIPSCYAWSRIVETVTVRPLEPEP